MSSLITQFRSLPRSRVVIAGLAFLATTIIMAMFLLESRWGYSGRVVPVVFFKSWPADRSAADTAADEAKVVAGARADAAQSRAYMATLSGPAKVKAQNQYNAFIAAEPKPLQPEGFIAPTTK